MASTVDALRLRRVMGRKVWTPAQPYGPDGWRMVRQDGRASVIVTAADHDGDEWIHASVAFVDIMPTYADLVRLHRAAFGDDRWAYQVFAPRSAHVNIHQFALHLWGRVDGAPALPDFAPMGSI
jgi:hypothetical protein